MAEDSYRRIAWNVVVPMCVGLALATEVGMAQVVIKERVEISQDAAEKTSTPVPIIEAPFDGTLHIAYYLAHSHPDSILSTDTLFATSNGSLLASEPYIQARFDTATTQPYECNGQIGPRYTYQTLSLDPWIAGPVKEGDLISLATNSMQVPVYDQSTDSTWTAIVQSADQCDDLYLLVSVVRDTLDIHFTPAEDSNIYPEPGLIIEVKASVKDVGNNGEVVFEIENHDYPDTEHPDTLIYFLSEDGADTTLTIDPVPVENDTASTRLVVKKGHAAVVDVTAKYFVEVVSKNAAVPELRHEKKETWQDDEDNDGIADWWEDQNGGRCLLDPNWAPGQPGCDDSLWDEEHSESHDQDGDGITKLQEFRGVYIAQTKMPLSPEEKEVFVDHHLSSHGAWAVSQTQQSAIDVTLIEVSGLKHVSAEVVEGNDHLKWNSPLKDGESFHYILIKDTTFTTLKAIAKEERTTGRINHELKGLVISGSVYSLDGTDVLGPECENNSWCAQDEPAEDELQEAPAFGFHGRVVWDAGGHTHSYRQVGVPMWTISNWWNSNNIRGDVEHEFWMRLLTKNGFDDFATHFYGTGDGEDVNPVQMLSNAYTRENAKPTGLVLELDQETFEKRVTLHEFGHALGMWPSAGEDKHPSVRSHISVMTPAHGLGIPFNFDPNDIMQIDLKTEAAE